MANGRFIADITIPDDTELHAGSSFVKTWRVANRGTTSWQGVTLTFLSGTVMTSELSHAIPILQPEEQLDISLTLTAPETAGVYTSRWVLRTADGARFEPLLFTRIVVPEVVGQTMSNGRYLADLTIPDGTQLEIGQSFTKTWQVENNGPTRWGIGFTLRHESGEPMTDRLSHPVPVTEASQAADLSLALTVPSTVGRHVGYWRLYDAGERPFGDRLFLDIQAIEPLPDTPFDPKGWRNVIWSITSVFETGKAEGDPAAYQTVDSGIISYGKHQATLRSGNLHRVVDAYVNKRDDDNANTLRADYLERLREKDEGLREDGRLRALLLQAAVTQEMDMAQDDVFDAVFFQKSVTLAKQYKVKTPLGLACIYDTSVQGGVYNLLPEVKEQLGGVIGENGITEAQWLTSFLSAREARLNRLADSYEAKGNDVNARALRISIFRVTELRKLLELNNLHLAGELNVRGRLINGL